MPTICTVVFDNGALYPFAGIGDDQKQAFDDATELDSIHLWNICADVGDNKLAEACAKIWHEGGTEEEYKDVFSNAGINVYVFYNVLA